jgi:hypothetical protein
MRVSLKVVLVFSLATFLLFVLDQYYYDGHRGLLLLLVHGGLPSMTFCDSKEPTRQPTRRM